MFSYFTKDRNPFAPNWQEELQKKEVLSQLIGINVLVFLVVTVSRVLFWLFGSGNLLVEAFSVPSNYYVLATRPWGILTYMFIHSNFFHLLFNMIWLYWAGALFVKYFDTKKLLWLYIGGGIGGAILYILLYNTLPVFALENLRSYAIGASASVMAIFFAVAIYDPTRPVYLFFIGKIQMLHLAIGVIVIDLIMMPNGNAGGHISHFGGALVGVAFALLMKQFASPKTRTKFQQSTYKHAKDFAYNTEKQEEQDEINAILDKISKSGYESLTTHERKLLFKSSFKK